MPSSLVERDTSLSGKKAVMLNGSPLAFPVSVLTARLVPCRQEFGGDISEEANQSKRTDL